MTEYAFVNESGVTELRGTLVPDPGPSGFAPVTCVLEAFPLDVHAVGVLPLKWTALFNNPSAFTPLVAIPVGLGLTFTFDGSAATITTTTAGTWAFTLGGDVTADATWEGAVTLDPNTAAVANCPVPPVGQSASFTITQVVTVPSGYAIAPNIATTAGGTANPLAADVFLTIVRLG